MTNAEVIELATSLRALGVARFALGDLHIDFVPVALEGEDEERATERPPSPMEAAAIRLAGAGGRV
jgi:hypothetical protein